MMPEPVKPHRPLDHPGDAKVGQVTIALRVHQHVAGLDVAVDDAELVRVFQRRADLHHHAPRFIQRERSALQPIGERARLDVAHHQVEVAVLLAVIVDGQDVQVFQFGNDLGFLLKAFDERRVLGEMRGKHFERDVAIHRGLVSFVDGRHAAQADLVDDAIGSECFSDQVGHVSPPTIF